MDFEKRIAELTAYIADQVHMIYHKSPEDAERDFKASKYYPCWQTASAGFCRMETSKTFGDIKMKLNMVRGTTTVWVELLNERFRLFYIVNRW